jgi:hypothetical protein
MIKITDFPTVVCAISFVLLWLALYIAAWFQKKKGPLKETERDDFNVIQGAALTLLGLLIGFTFSMSVSRYEERKNFEEAEANAIGTEYVRAGLLPATDTAALRDLLRHYLDQRVLFYSTRDRGLLAEVGSQTAKLQAQMWSVVEARAASQPSPMTALAVSGMNDVLNSQGYTQAAWLNRIPTEAWYLLLAIAIGSNFLFGYSAHRPSLFFIVLPLAVSLSFFLIADIDSPRWGLIRVSPENLASLSETLRSK